MPSPSTPSASASKKELRRQRFFAAISPNTSQAQQGQKVKCNSQESAQTTSKEPQSSNSQSAMAAAAAALVAATPTPDVLDASTAAKLTDMHRQMLVEFPDAIDAPANEAERQASAQMSEAFFTIPPEQLPPQWRYLQRESLAMTGPLLQLFSAREETLTPQLLDLKHRLADLQRRWPQDPNNPSTQSNSKRLDCEKAVDDIERRVNDLLRANGERKVQLPRPDLDKEASGSSAARQLQVREREVLERDFVMRMADLSRRKPRLRTEISDIMKSIMDVFK